jgi:modification methylase
MNNPHPAPFPLSLIDRIISSTYAKTVLDPFMGSGTTAIAALMNDREYLGIELSPEYIKMAEKRISDFQSQGKIKFLQKEVEA